MYGFLAAASPRLCNGGEEGVMDFVFEFFQTPPEGIDNIYDEVVLKDPNMVMYQFEFDAERKKQFLLDGICVIVNPNRLQGLVTYMYDLEIIGGYTITGMLDETPTCFHSRQDVEDFCVGVAQAQGEWHATLHSGKPTPYDRATAPVAIEEDPVEHEEGPARSPGETIH